MLDSSVSNHGASTAPKQELKSMIQSSTQAASLSASSTNNSLDQPANAILVGAEKIARERASLRNQMRAAEPSSSNNAGVNDVSSAASALAARSSAAIDLNDDDNNNNNVLMTDASSMRPSGETSDVVNALIDQVISSAVQGESQFNPDYEAINPLMFSEWKSQVRQQQNQLDENFGPKDQLDSRKNDDDKDEHDNNNRNNNNNNNNNNANSSSSSSSSNSNHNNSRRKALDRGQISGLEFSKLPDPYAFASETTANSQNPPPSYSSSSYSNDAASQILARKVEDPIYRAEPQNPSPIPMIPFVSDINNSNNSGNNNNRNKNTNNNKPEKEESEAEKIFNKQLNLRCPIDLSNPLASLTIRLESRRKFLGIPEDVNGLSLEQMKMEKSLVKKELRRFDKRFEEVNGKPVSPFVIVVAAAVFMILNKKKFHLSAHKYIYIYIYI